eukprot:7488480-Prorocentrum_lima.AAC.1
MCVTSAPGIRTTATSNHHGGGQQPRHPGQPESRGDRNKWARVTCQIPVSYTHLRAHETRRHL